MEYKIHRGIVIQIDEADLEKVKQHKWYKHVKGYVVSTLPGETLRLHQFLLGWPPKDMVIDHIDRDKLNNKRDNLRFITYSASTQNRDYPTGASSYRGVSWVEKTGKWFAYINKDKKRHRLGFFISAEDAARAYDKKAKELFGTQTRLNFPNE